MQAICAPRLVGGARAEVVRRAQPLAPRAPDKTTCIADPVAASMHSGVARRVASAVGRPVDAPDGEAALKTLLKSSDAYLEEGRATVQLFESDKPKLLREGEAAPTSSSKTPSSALVFDAARDGNVVALAGLLETEANAFDADGLSVLHHAVDAEQLDPVLDAARRIAFLPVVHCGLGLRSSALLSPAAYWAAWADMLPTLVERAPELAEQVLQEPESGD